MDVYARDSSRERNPREKKMKKDRSHDRSKKSKKDKIDKSKRRRHDSSDEDDIHPDPKRTHAEDLLDASRHRVPSPVEPRTVVAPAASIPASKIDFFSQLIKEESKKGQIGTAHAVGKDKNQLPTSSSQDWICPKCSTSNFKNSNQCQKCRALKRMSTYR